jgi:hypothetical protein
MAALSQFAHLRAKQTATENPYRINAMARAGGIS